MIISIIHKYYYNLTEVERKVADYVLENSQEVVRMTVSELARRCNVAPSAVIRFCKAINISGFSELKIMLASQIKTENELLPKPTIEDEQELKSIVNKVFTAGAQAISDTEKIIDINKIERIVSVLSKAKRICIFAVGTSSIVANDVQYRLSQLGFWATAYTDVLFMNVTAVNLTPHDVVIAVSHSGRTKAVVDAVRHSKKSGAKTIAITSFCDSILYKECDISVSVFADEINYPVEAVSARLAHMCLMDAITMSLTTYAKGFPNRINARNKILEEIRY